MTVNTKTSKSLFVSWSQLPDDFIKGFNVTATYVGPCDSSNAAADFTMNLLHPSLRQLNITGLNEHSNYSVVITAFNKARNNATERIFATTGQSGMKNKIIPITLHNHNNRYSMYYYNNIINQCST